MVSFEVNAKAVVFDIMAMVDFLQQHPQPTGADIDANLTNICRCGTYVRIRAAALIAMRATQ